MVDQEVAGWINGPWSRWPFARVALLHDLGTAISLTLTTVRKPDRPGRMRAKADGDAEWTGIQLTPCLLRLQ